MTGAPLPVTVVLPAFNAECTLDRALRSVNDQTSHPAEIVVVDDASTDDTAARLRAAADAAGPIPTRVVSLGRNAGAAEARNAGLAAASPATRYIAFLDADDWWLPRKLERQIGWMQDHPEVPWTAHRCTVGEPAAARLATVAAPVTSPISLRRLLIRNPIATAAVAVRRPIAAPFRTGWRHCEDLMAWIDWITAGREGVMLEEPLACLDRPPATPGGLCGDRPAMAAGELRVLDELGRAGRLLPLERLIWRAYFRLRQLRRSLC